MEEPKVKNYFSNSFCPPPPYRDTPPRYGKAKNLKNDARPTNVPLTYAFAFKITIQGGTADMWLCDFLMSRQS